jgi:hypothetical protein
MATRNATMMEQGARTAMEILANLRKSKL